MTKKEIDALAEAFAKRHGSYKDWTFERTHQGSFAYNRADGAVSIYFTPDNSEPGQVDIAIGRDDGSEDPLADVRYIAPLTADDLFASVKGWLDRYE